jgi:iron-sulfur cluster insertion protein
LTTFVGLFKISFNELFEQTMSVVETFQVSPLVLTENAARKILSLVTEEDNPSLKLRVYVTGGGCSGFQYGFSFDDTVNDDDTQVENLGATLLIDPLSIQYLTGSQVDYQEGLQGARFTVINPLATTTCGCGMSFSI